MFSLFSNKKVGEWSILLDIQSGLVRGALAKRDDDGEIHISSVVTKSFSGKNHIVNAEHLTKKTLKLIFEVIEVINKNSRGIRISKIDYILSSPWVVSNLKTIKVDFETEKEITPKLIHEIIENELEANKAMKNAVIVEQKILEIKLNGYPTFSFEGKKAHKLEVSLSTSFSSSEFIEKINEIVDRNIHIKNHKLHPALLLQYEAIRSVLKNKNEFIYIHIHSELTDIIVVKDGLCKYMSSFPFGISSLLRKIISKTKQNIESGDSILSLYQGNKLDQKEKARLEKIVKPTMNEWSKSCIESFENIFDMTNIPRTIYLSAHSHFELFKDSLLFENKFNFDIVTYDSIKLGEEIYFEGGSEQSNMMKMYAISILN